MPLDSMTAKETDLIMGLLPIEWGNCDRKWELSMWEKGTPLNL